MNPYSEEPKRLQELLLGRRGDQPCRVTRREEGRDGGQRRGQWDCQGSEDTEELQDRDRIAGELGRVLRGALLQGVEELGWGAQRLPEGAGGNAGGCAIWGP